MQCFISNIDKFVLLPAADEAKAADDIHWNESARHKHKPTLFHYHVMGQVVLPQCDAQSHRYVALLQQGITNTGIYLAVARNLP